MKKILIVYMSGFMPVVNNISKIIKKNSNSQISLIHRRLLSNKIIKRHNLVITVGGDGTYMRTSHFIYDSTPILGINPRPTQKEGFFTPLTIKNYKKNLENIFKKKSKIKKYHRLYAKINSKKIDDLALNEFYFGMKLGYHLSNYELKIKSKKEYQRSSGVLIGTAQSSHSWIGSAGGKHLKSDEKKFQFVVREPYLGKLNKFSIFNGILSSRQKMYLSPKTKGFILVVDSLKEIIIEPKDKIEIGFSSKPLNYISF